MYISCYSDKSFHSLQMKILILLQQQLLLINMMLAVLIIISMRLKTVCTQLSRSYPDYLSELVLSNIKLVKR